MGNGKFITLLESANATAPGAAVAVNVRTPLNFMVTLAGTNTVTATTIFEGTNNPTVAASWSPIATATSSGVTTAVDVGVSLIPWPWVRARISAISATSAIATMGV